MKNPSIIIQTVSNGWIVTGPLTYRDYSNSYGPADKDMAVFTRMEDLQAALPGLLTEPASELSLEVGQPQVALPKSEHPA